MSVSVRYFLASVESRLKLALKHFPDASMFTVNGSEMIVDSSAKATHVRVEVIDGEAWLYPYQRLAEDGVVTHVFTGRHAHAATTLSALEMEHDESYAKLVAAVTKESR